MNTAVSPQSEFWRGAKDCLPVIIGMLPFALILGVQGGQKGMSPLEMSLSLKSIPLGTAYAVWAGVGLVLTCLVSMVFFGQKADIAGIVGVGFILAGVVILNTWSGMVRH